MIGSFDRIGFRRHRRTFRAADLDVDLSGCVCLVTGGNAGLGRATAEALAKRGATVHLLCRDAARAEGARDEIRRTSGNARVELAVVDVSDLAPVRRYVASAGIEHHSERSVARPPGYMDVQQWDEACIGLAPSLDPVEARLGVSASRILAVTPAATSNSLRVRCRSRCAPGPALLTAASALARARWKLGRGWLALALSRLVHRSAVVVLAISALRAALYRVV